jgi:hypothetical protein
MSIYEAIALGKHGLWVGNRLLLPFHGHFLKIVIGDEIITDFSMHSRFVEIDNYESFTSIYFLKYDDLKDIVTESKPIRIIVVEEHDDVFSVNSHKKLSLFFREKHEVVIENNSEELTFLE